eukprot:6439419-Pyramimonas_sp.AAC.1
MMGITWATLRSPGGLVGLSWDHLGGACLPCLPLFWAVPVPSLSSLGALSRASWAVPGPSRSFLGGLSGASRGSL